jgi:DNA (cytosine-5)-methyltransferase 1
MSTNNSTFKLASLFSGCGGLDLGFKKVGFETVWANEYDKTIWKTFHNNFPETFLDTRSIVDIKSNEIPNVDGIIGGPPCQSWSEAGAGKGAEDNRGKLFWEYIRILRDKKPYFFLAENVSGILSKKHQKSFIQIINDFEEAGYDIFYKLLNAKDFNVAEDRERVIIIGFRKDLRVEYTFPRFLTKRQTLRDVIYDLKDNAKPAKSKNYTNGESDLVISNHEFMIGGFSSIYMSRNRVRAWNEQSYTIQAGGRQAPIHPNAPKMSYVEKDKFEFCKTDLHLYRRLSIRECLRIQDFPDSFKLHYTNLADGYKMVGNAVPVGLAYHLAKSILHSLKNIQPDIKLSPKISEKKTNFETVLF